MIKRLLSLLLAGLLLLTPAYAVSTDACYDEDDTSLMLHFDGTDASTTFTDEIGQTVTPAADAQIDTAQMVFGTASGLFDGTGDELSIPDSAGFAMGTGNFNISLRLRPHTMTVEDGIIHQSGGLLVTAWFLRFSPNTANNLQFAVYSAGLKVVEIDAAHGMSVDTWYDVKVIRGWGGVADTWAITVNGNDNGTTSDADSMVDSFDVLIIGGNVQNQAGRFDGHIDELRIVKGLAIETGDHTPEPAAYTECGGRRIITT